MSEQFELVLTSFFVVVGNMCPGEVLHHQYRIGYDPTCDHGIRHPYDHGWPSIVLLI